MNSLSILRRRCTLYSSVTHRTLSTAIAAHITDVEGNQQKFSNAIQASSCLEERNGELHFTNNNSQFVFGGDAADKGPHSIRLLRSLSAFKSKHPDRVHLLVGNREAKMTRLREELQCPKVVRQRLVSDVSVFWEKKTPPNLFVEQLMQEAQFSGSISEYISSLPDDTCQSLYMKWMFNHTMGCGKIKMGTDSPLDSFELYRQELAALLGASTESVTDEAVTQFLLKESEPEGSFGNYLKQGVLAHRIGDTLFVHGAVTAVGIGYVPDMSSPLSPDTSLDTWIGELNRWFSNEITQWSQSETFAANNPPGNTSLMHYLVFNPKSVTTTNWYDSETRKIEPLSDKVVKYLMRNGVNRVMSGHQPFSDCPLVLKHPSGFEVIVGDTSYSDPTAPLDTQGKAFNVCEVHSTTSNNTSTATTSNTTKVIVHATRKNGVHQTIDLSDPSMASMGTILPGGKGVVRLNEKGEWITSQLKGFSVEDTIC